MWKNYLTVALRNLRKHPGFALINAVGLSVGLACCLLIFLFVQDELGFDAFHAKADRIYRVVETIEGEGGGERSASAPFPVAEALLNDFPAYVEEAVRFFDFQAPALALAYGEEKRFNESRLFFADSTVFQVFSFPLLQGNPRTALAEPGTIVLAERMVRKYFGDEDPMGKVLRFENDQDLRVTGVMADTPPNAHFQIDFLASFATLIDLFGGSLPPNWYWNPCWTYVLLPEGVAPETLEARLPAFVEAYFPDIIKNDLHLTLQPLTDIHLHSRLDYEIEPNSSAANTYIFSAVALFILLIACINFMNLATARSAGRAREVGMRKVLGAYRSQLVRQFLTESMLMSLVAVLMALGLVELMLPAFNAFAGKDLALDVLHNPMLLAGLGLITLGVGFASGLYPAFALSRFEPVPVLKGALQTGLKGLLLRRALVVAQFTISIILIAGTIVAYNQLRYLLTAEIGFDKEQVIMLPASRTPIAESYETFKQELLQHAGITSVTALEEVLGAKHQTGNYQFEGMAESRLLPRLVVRHDFERTFGIVLAAGRSYEEAFPADAEQSLVVNEALVRQMGWPSPEAAVGKTFDLGQGKGQIIGVVKDFHFTSLHQPIAPLVLDLNTHPNAFNLFIKYVAVRVRPADLPATLAHVERQWARFAPGRAFAYFFLDENLDQLYKAEDKLGSIAGLFSFLAIGVACLGLFGLASFTTEQRTKEIGVRKVLGASVPGLVLLLSKEFARLVLVAFLVAVPVAHLAMHHWLSGFAYRTDIGVLPFVLAGLLALAIALLTVSYQATKAALTDPVKSLRYE